MTQRIRTFTEADVKLHSVTMLRCNLRTELAAKALGLSQRSMNDRLKRIKDQTGLNLRVYNQCLQAAKGGVCLG